MNVDRLENNKKRMNQSLGHHEFTEDFFEQILHTLSPVTLRALELNELRIKMDTKWLSVLKQLQKTKIIYLMIRQNKYIPVYFSTLSLISHISFMPLQQLDIKDNRIESIEAIAFLQMNQLRKIFIQGNFITSLKPFNKTIWPKLRAFAIDGNKLQYTDMSRTGIKEFSYVSFSYYNDQDIQLQIEDPKTLVKNQHPQISQLFLHKDPSVIFSQNIYKSLINRFQNPDIQWSNEYSQ